MLWLRPGGVCFLPNATHTDAQRSTNIIEQAIPNHDAFMWFDSKTISNRQKNRRVRLGMWQIRGIDDFIEQSINPMSCQVGIMPVSSPPGIREQAKTIALFAQFQQCRDGIIEDRGPAADGTGIAVKGSQQFFLTNLNLHTVEGILYYHRWRAARLDLVDALP